MAFLSNIQHLLNGVDIDNLLRDINSFKKDISSAKKEISRYSTLLTEKYNEIASLKQQNVSLSADMTREKNKYSILEGKVGDLSKTIAELKKEHEILENSEQKFKDKYEKATKSNASLNGKNLALTNKIKALEEKKTQLKTDQLKLQSELSDKDAIISMMGAKYNKLQSDYNNNKEQLEEINKTFEDEKTAKKVLEENITQLQEKNRILSENFDSLQVTVDELANENSRLKEYSVEAKEKIDLLTEENSNKESEKSALRKELDKQKTENDSLQQQLQELVEEKEELSPYMYLVEEKKEQEAIESAIKESRENLQNSLDSAMSILSTIKHEEIKKTLEDAIKFSRELVDSVDCTLEELNDSKRNLDSASNEAEEQEKELIEQEEAERKRKEEEKAEQKRKEEEERLKSTSVNTEEAVDDAFEDDTLPIIYGIGLIPAEKLSIPEVYDVKEERIVNARDFFSQHESELILWRRNLQEEYLMGNARFICPECKQPVKISGHKLQRGRVCYFAHFKDSDDCPYKTGTNMTKEEIERLKYSLVQESERHKRLKAAIASALEGEKSKSMGVGKVECEKRINSEIPYLKWRRPDIYAEYNGRKYVFELQLSTTFVSVIVDRDIFYRLNDYNIIWVFNFEDNKEYVSLHNLMCKDIYYANKRNIFIFDADTEELSKERGELVLKCRWLDANGVWSSDEFVTLDMFQYDEESHKPFIIDADKAYLEKHPEYVERRKQLEISREDILKGLMERQKHEEELERRRDAERTNLQMKLFNTDKCVERFRSGTKYGYRFEGTTILPAKYTSAETIGENGYAKVKFNRKIGLVRKDGKEIVPVEYKNIDIINSQHGIVMASYKRVDLWLGDEYFSLRSDYNDKEQSIIKEDENGKTNYILQTNSYSYSYSQSYYGGYPICHKNWSGHSNSTLFTVVEENDFCIIWIDGKTYLLSKNRLSAVNGSYSDVKSIGFNQLFIAKDLRTELWGVIDLQGYVVTEFKYATLIPTESEYLIAKYETESGTYGLIDYQGREFIVPQYEALFYLSPERFAFRNNHLWGICDCMGNIVHEASFTCVRRTTTGSIMASTLESYSSKWEVENNVPSYNDNLLLCLVNDDGEIVYTEITIGQYHIRHSGDLYSIFSSNNEELVSYSLSDVLFVSETIAVIKKFDGNSGLFVNGELEYFDGCKEIEQLCDGIYKLIFYYGNVKLYSLEEKKASEDSFIDITRLMGEMFVVKTNKHHHNNVYQLYKGIEPLSSEYFSSVVLLANGYIALQKYGIGHNAKPTWKLANNDFTYLSVREYDSIIEANEELFKVSINGNEGFVDLNGNAIVEKNYCDNGLILTHCFADRGLEDADGTVILSLSEHYSSIEFIKDTLLKVCKQNKYALFSIKGETLTDFKYTDIFCGEDGSIQATRNNIVGSLDINGNEIGDVETFTGGYLKSAYGDYSVFNDADEIIIPTGYSKIEILDNDGILALWKGSKVKLYSLEEKKASEDSFIDITRLMGEMFVVKTNKHHHNNVYQLYKGIEPLSSEYFSSVVLLANGYIALQKYGIGHNAKPTWKLANNDFTYLSVREYDSIIEANEELFKVSINGNEGFVDLNGNAIVEKNYCDNGLILTHCFADRGLEDADGTVILSLSEHYSSIEFIKDTLLKVCKQNKYALFSIKGETLTDFKYTDILCREDGTIQATRNNIVGRLDANGNEIADVETFAGGYLKSLYGDYSVFNDVDEIIIPTGYSKIEILDNDGILALWKGNKVAIGNIANEKTEFVYESVRSIGNGFYVVSRTFSKKTRVRHTGYGYRGNSYTYYTLDNKKEKKYGIIDRILRIVITCKYSSISDFDDEQNLTATNSNGENKTISLQKLKKKASHALELSVGTEYDAKVQYFMPIGLIIKIQGKSFVVHKKYLFKEKKVFKKGESFIAKYLGKDENGHPIWETKLNRFMD